MNRPPAFLRLGLILILSLAGLTRLAAQATQIWGSGTGPWDTTTANWSGAVWTNGNNATIGTTGARTGTLTITAGGVSVNNVSSGSGGGAAYVNTLTGGPLTLSGAASVWNIGGATGSQLQVDSAILGASSLDKQGTRLLILTGNNTYSGGTTVTAGQLQIGNGGTSGSVAGNIVANSTLTFNRSDTLTYSGIISGTSAVTHAGSGTLVLAGDSTDTNSLTVSAGTLQLGNGGATGSWAGGIVNNGAVVFNRSAALNYTRAISGTGGVTINGTGAINLNAASTYAGATTVNSGATLGGTGSVTSAVTVANGGTLAGRNAQIFTTGALTLNGTSNLDVTLGAPSTTGLFLVNGNLTLDGTLNITDGGGFGPGLYRLIDYTGALTDNGLVLGLTGGASASSLAIQTATANQVNLFYDAGPANIWRGGAGTWNADAASSGWTDVLGVINNPWPTSNFAIFTGSAGTVTIDTAFGAVVVTGAQFAVDGFTVAGGALTNNTAAAIFRVGNGTAGGAAMTGTISAPIVGTGGLNKTDLGTLVLSGTNTYAGTTTVSSGILSINGNNSAATGATTVNSGATLAGSGTLGGSVTVANGGTLAAQSGQVLTLGALTLNNTSNFNVTIGAPGATRLVQVNGALTLDGILNVTDGGGFAPGVTRLIDYTGALTDNTLVVGTAPVGLQFLAVQTSIANQVNLVFDAGPRNFWRGGSNSWTASTASTAWSDFTLTPATFWTPQFAIFQAAPGLVTIDTSAGAVEATGAQFAVNGYTVAGGALTNNTAAAIFRVGDGTAGGSAVSATISAPIVGTGGIDKTDLGTLVLSGTNLYSGTTAVSGGTLRVNGDSSGVTGAVAVHTGGTLGGNGTLGGAVTVENGGTLTGQSGSTLTFGSLTLNPTANVNVTLGAPSDTALFQVNGNLTLDGTLNVASGSGFGPGVYRLMNYTGSLTDNGLVFGTTPVATSFLSLQTSIANQVNFIFNAGANNFWTGGSGTWTANPAGTAWKDFGGFTSTAWTPQFAIFQNAPAGTVTIDTSAGAVVATGAQFAVTGYTIAGGALTNNTAGAIFRVGDGSAGGAAMSATISAPITGTGGINKTDLGTLVLSGANSYAGTTAVSAGTLRINGNQSAATGAVSVASGAFLGGSGTTGAAVTIANGGTLAGQSGQTLTMASLVLNGTSNVNLTLGAPSLTTLFQVNGNFTLDGTLNLTSGAGFGPGLYRLFNYTGALTDNGLVFGSTAGVGVASFSLQTTTANQVNLLYQDIVTVLPLWTGGSGTWSGNPAGSGFTNGTGSISGGWRPGFAIFQGTPGTVTIDSTAGPVEVTGIQFASNGYTVTGGSLTLNTPNAVFRVGDGTSAGTGMTATINAPISGGGSMLKTDLGTLILGGANTYAGGTAVLGGVLQVASNGNLGAGNTLSLDGGTLRSSAGFATGRAVTLGAGGGTFDTGANTLVLSGALTGSGTLTKTGSGQLTLSGTNSYTGATTISAGTLFLDNTSASASASATTIAAAGILAGNGTIRGALVNNGRLSPGASPGTITVTGNYTQSASGIYAVEIASATSFDKLVVTGAASLNGALVVTGLNGFVPGVGQSFTILTAAGGVTGTFVAVSSPWDHLSAMLGLQAVYHANDVTLAVAQLPFAGLAGSANQLAVGSAVDGAIVLDAIPNLRAALNAAPTTAGVLAAMTELSPRRYDRWFAQAAYSSDATVRSAENRLAETGNRPETGLWMELVRRDSRFDADGESTKAKGSANGVIVGGDTRVIPAWKLGALFSYANETLALDTAGSRTTTGRVTGVVYSRFDASPVLVEAEGGIGLASLGSRRTIDIPGYAAVAGSKTDSYESFFNLRVGYPLAWRGTEIMPYAAAKIMSWNANNFVETGAGDASLSVDRQTGKSLASRLGFTASHAFDSGRGRRFTARFDLAWRLESETDPHEIGATLGGADFTVEGGRPASSGVMAGVGFDAAVGEKITAYVRLDAEKSTAADQAFGARAGFTYRF